MQLTTTIDLRGALTKLEAMKITAKDTERALKIAALGQVSAIKSRTEKGFGLSGLFKPYSESYSIFKLKKGRSGTPNLNFTGQMMGSLGLVSASPFEAVVSFHNKGSSDKKATPLQKAGYNQKTRPFMGVNDKEKALIIKRFKGALFK